MSEEDVKAKGPFPDIALSGEPNDDAILAAYRTYVDIHSRGEVDKGLHD